MSRIFLSKPDITELEAEYVLDAVRSGWVAPLGPHVDAFEREVASYVGVEHALALSSGTAALHLALLGVGASHGRAVVVSTLTFAASANAIAYTGAEPVFIDSYLEDGNVDADLLFAAIDELQQQGTEVAAAMVVDLLGRCADYPRIVAGLSKRGVPLIEDAAESLGASLPGGAAGSYGQAAALSFNGNKIMTTAGGGMLLSNDAEFIAQARYLSTQARSPVPWYEHEEIGYNYRLSNILAALGRAQLQRLDSMVHRRLAIRELYVQALSHVEGISFLGVESRTPGARDNYWLTSLVVDPRTIRTPVADLIGKLESTGIEARHIWKPMHLQPAYSQATRFLNGNAEYLFRQGLTLPSGSSMSDADVKRVSDTLLAALKT